MSTPDQLQQQPLKSRVMLSYPQMPESPSTLQQHQPVRWLAVPGGAALRKKLQRGLQAALLGTNSWVRDLQSCTNSQCQPSRAIHMLNSVNDKQQTPSSGCRMAVAVGPTHWQLTTTSCQQSTTHGCVFLHCLEVTINSPTSTQQVQCAHSSWAGPAMISTKSHVQQFSMSSVCSTLRNQVRNQSRLSLAAALCWSSSTAKMASIHSSLHKRPLSSSSS